MEGVICPKPCLLYRQLTRLRLSVPQHAEISECILTIVAVGK
jgi:hypothetical protein